MRRRPAAAGRHTTGPLVERYLARLHADGVLVAADSAAAFSLFYGLVVQDAQIRALLGEASPSLGNHRRTAETAVDHFLALTSRPASLDDGQR